MYIINDIELLEKLHKHQMLTSLIQSCTISVAGIRISDYSYRIRSLIQSLQQIKVLHVEKTDFDEWANPRRKFLSISDLSSIYIALCNEGADLVLSAEEQLLIKEANRSGVNCLPFDSFFVNIIKDEKIIRLYNLIKAA